MQLNSWRTNHQIAVENEPATGSWLVGASGVTSIEMLVGGVVVISRESGRDVVIGPNGYGVAVRELQAPAPIETKKGRAK